MVFHPVATFNPLDKSAIILMPLERISIKMVFRSLYFLIVHDAYGGLRLRKTDYCNTLRRLVEHQRSMGLVKAVR
ncbi:hypothetical protein [Nostoc sp.]|uniref:hypothetical protein n=1 Tax=Nostoc sp. TaxID=1180 RepID=UPI002FFC8761